MTRTTTTKIKNSLTNHLKADMVSKFTCFDEEATCLYDDVVKNKDIGLPRWWLITFLDVFILSIGNSCLIGLISVCSTKDFLDNQNSICIQLSSWDVSWCVSWSRYMDVLNSCFCYSCELMTKCFTSIDVYSTVLGILW